MATGTSAARLAMSEHLPNRHVTVCRSGLHQSLRQLNAQLDLVKAEIDKQSKRLISTQMKLVEYSEAGKEVFRPEQTVEEQRERSKPERWELIPSLVSERPADSAYEKLRAIEEKYSSRAKEITAREDAARVSTLRHLRESMNAASTPSKHLGPLHESSLYIHYYC